MRRRAAIIFRALVAATLCALSSAAPAAGSETRVAELIAQMLAAAGTEVGGEPLTEAPALGLFYSERGHAPAWTDPDRVDELLALVSSAADHGLQPEDYLAGTLRSRLASDRRSASETAELELLLSESFLRYYAHRTRGKVDARRLDPGDALAAEPNGPPALAASLAGAVASDSLPEYLRATLPGSPLYEELLSALADYRALAAAGGWPTVPPGPTLREGDRDARIPVLRARLAVTGDAPSARAAQPELFDAPLAAAVRSFQSRHQIDADGLVGKNTLAALNVQVGARIDQLRLSLERLRWVQGEPPRRFVAVNIAGFRAFMVSDGEVRWSGRVMVGRDYRQTPVFRSGISYLELNPAWNVPPTILNQDLLPKLKADSTYLAGQHMRLLDLDGRELDASTIDWNAYADHVPFLVHQDPGPWNALGAVKFGFPNAHAVFMHDTPHRELFEHPQRSVSSGCIRVENPVELAARLFDGAAGRGSDELRSLIASGETRRIPVDPPVPIFLLYLTASVRDDGRVYFFPDIYGRDARVLAALDAPIGSALITSTP